MLLRRMRLVCFFCLAFPPFSPAAFSQSSATQTLFLSGRDKDHPARWDFFCTSGRNSGVWTSIAVPSNWETQGFGTYTHGFDLKPEERGLYKRTFTISNAWRGKNVEIIFEGAMTDTEVKVNGQSAGPTHQGGFYRFRYDITKLLHFGQSNLLEVTVNKESTDPSVIRAERQGDYWNFGGLYRPVSLEAFPSEHIERVAVNAQADGTFSIDAFLQNIQAADTLTAQIQTLDGRPVGQEFRQSLAPHASKTTLTTKIDAPKLWTAETPNLYQVKVSLRRGNREIHQVRQKFGFRTIEVRPGDGIYVNGSKIVLKGAPRHDFWPDSGRATGPRVGRADVLLMKAMNMNAVLTAHYPPDASFLDACDELGLYVLDELAGWQKKYDTAIGDTLLGEMVVRDVNHPSILFWCNGNEGGWNTDLDAHFELFDPQKRKVLHPWTLFSGIQTKHYPNYDAVRQYVNGENIFMPTEFLHGLYDGGAGAGLDDYWNLMMSKPLGAGGFIWAFLDEGLVRADRGGAIDVAGNNYPDGILGPYRQKEGSFYTIKDIWSPVQLTDSDAFEASFPKDFDGGVEIRNRFAFTNAASCRFDWQLIRFQTPDARRDGHDVLARGRAVSPDVAPGASDRVTLALPADWRRADALRLSVTDPAGLEISSWTWPIRRAADFRRRLVPDAARAAPASAVEDADRITLTARGMEICIGKSTGRLESVTHDGARVSLSNGPTLTAGTAVLTGVTHRQEGDTQIVRAEYTGNLAFVEWRLHGNGWLELRYKYNLTGPQEFVGVNFDYPEKNVTGVKWLGKGPYRVWKNRMRGVQTDVWSKAYNDTATGADTWQYPEFKGYHAETYWAQLQTTEGKITLVAQDDGLFLRLFTPRSGPDPRFAAAAFPGGDISLLDGIPPVGNKFSRASDTGPQGASLIARGDYERTVFFYFGELTAAGREK